MFIQKRYAFSDRLLCKILKIIRLKVTIIRMKITAILRKYENSACLQFALYLKFDDKKDQWIDF